MRAHHAHTHTHREQRLSGHHHRGHGSLPFAKASNEQLCRPLLDGGLVLQVARQPVDGGRALSLVLPHLVHRGAILSQRVLDLPGREAAEKLWEGGATLAPLSTQLAHS